MKIFVVHLIDYDGGRPGQTINQWYCGDIDKALLLAGAERERRWTREQNAIACNTLVYPGGWKVLTIPNVGGFTPMSHMAWDNWDFGRWTMMFITKEELA